jgi:pyruvate,water dikinase
LIESPNFFLKTILQGAEEEVDATEESEERVEKLAAEWRDALPEDKKESFDEILDMGRRFFRIRDERGLCTDLSGVGLCRRGILEAGRRLKAAGVVNEAEHLTVATKAEALSLLTGDLRNLSVDKTGPVDVPTSNVLESRFLYIKNANPNIVPRALGTPPPPPPDIPLPPGIARTMANMDTGLLKGIWDETPGTDEDVKDNPDRVVGVTASMGTVTAPVSLVLQDSDLQYVKKGDIIVTYSSSASFNMVLGLCSGIVTNYGRYFYLEVFWINVLSILMTGFLIFSVLQAVCSVTQQLWLGSMAFLVSYFDVLLELEEAEESSIVLTLYECFTYATAIVGTQHATEKFKSGDVVTIDSSCSSVTRVK